MWAHKDGCPWNEETCSTAAARDGYLDVLMWARENS
jgi:hypothetical protein